MVAAADGACEAHAVLGDRESLLELWAPGAR